jgi:hypothetical protein
MDLLSKCKQKLRADIVIHFAASRKQIKELPAFVRNELYELLEYLLWSSDEEHALVILVRAAKVFDANLVRPVLRDIFASRNKLVLLANIEAAIELSS